MVLLNLCNAIFLSDHHQKIQRCERWMAWWELHLATRIHNHFYYEFQLTFAKRRTVSSYFFFSQFTHINQARSHARGGLRGFIEGVRSNPLFDFQKIFVQLTCPSYRLKVVCWNWESSISKQVRVRLSEVECCLRHGDERTRANTGQLWKPERRNAERNAERK